MAELLLEAGADALRRSAIGASPRNVAERQGHQEMVQLLAASGSGGNHSHHHSTDGHNIDDWSRFDMRSLLQSAPRH